MMKFNARRASMLAKRLPAWRRVLLALGVTAGVSAAPLALAQMWGVWPGYGGGAGTTVAGSQLTGMANAISASGSYNLATSQAAINLEQADSMAIQNQLQATNAYFEQREMNRAYTAAENGPRPTSAQLARIAREGAPKPIAANQLDPVSGTVHWPPVLADDAFKSERGELEELVAKQAKYGILGFSDQTRARELIDSMFRTMKGQIRNIPSQQYSTSRSFLDSLIFSMTNSRLG